MRFDPKPSYHLPEGLPIPVPEPDGLSAPYRSGLQEDRLRVQRCTNCQSWQFGPEWICHRCLTMDLAWVDVEARGRIFSWERVWHPSHAALKDHGPYLVVLVELPEAGNVRMVGNLLGDPAQEVTIGAAVEGIFEHHDATSPSYSLLHWRYPAP